MEAHPLGIVIEISDREIPPDDGGLILLEGYRPDQLKYKTGARLRSTIFAPPTCLGALSRT
jgi:hypothetical protein